jgi:PRC-barrel domain
MAQGEARSLVDSDRIDGTPVLSPDGRRVGTIRRMIIDKSAGKIAYVVMSFAESFGLGDVTYVIPWPRLSYDKTSGGYRTEISQADLQSALPVAQGEAEWADREAEEAFFSIPPGWRTV